MAITGALLLSGCSKDVTNSSSSQEQSVATSEESKEAVSEEQDNTPENTQETEVEKTWKSAVENLPEDFIFGMDASSVLVEEKSGVKYYGFDGQEQDVFKTFSEAGINYIRLRDRKSVV